MNKRIKEFAEQAGMIIGDTSEFNMAKVMPKELKFAELIVKECMNLVTYVGHSTRGFDCCGHVRFTNEKIKEHFGIE